MISAPAPYRNPFLKRLADHPELEIKVIFLSKVCGDWNWHQEPECDFPHEFVEGPFWMSERNYYSWFHPKLIKLLEKEKPDVLVINGYFAPSMLWAALWSARKRKPFVFWSESHDRGVNQPMWRRMLRRALVNPLLRRASAHIAVGGYAGERIVRSGAEAQSVFKILNSPDVDEWLRQTDYHAGRRDEIRMRLGLSSGPVALFVGRMVPEKGVEELIEAFSIVKKKVVGKDLQLVLVGEGPMYEVVRKKYSTSVLKDVYFAGFCAPEELYPYYATADLFVLPSRYEPFGAVVHEAAASGLPLIVSDCCGAAAELVDSGSNGRIFKAGDVKELTETLMDMCEKRDEWPEMGALSRQLAIKYGYDFGEEQFLLAINRCVNGG